MRFEEDFLPLESCNRRKTLFRNLNLNRIAKIVFYYTMLIFCFSYNNVGKSIAYENVNKCDEIINNSIVFQKDPALKLSSHDNNIWDEASWKELWISAYNGNLIDKMAFAIINSSIIYPKLVGYSKREISLIVMLTTFLETSGCQNKHSKFLNVLIDEWESTYYALMEGVSSGSYRILRDKNLIECLRDRNKKSYKSKVTCVNINLQKKDYIKYYKILEQINNQVKTNHLLFERPRFKRY
jgi:hypothetical protein